MKTGLRQETVLAQKLSLKTRLLIASFFGLTVLGTLAGISALQPATFTVLHTGDTGPGSLRQALLDANAHRGSDRIEFHIPGEGPHRISPLKALPHINQPVVIDGYTQPGSAAATASDPARIQIEISGDRLDDGNGFTLVSRGCVIRGLAIHGFNHNARVAGILIQQNDNHIEGNYLGTDASGTLALPNAQGIYLLGASHNVIGGATPAQRNLISGNARLGLHLESNAQLRCQGNRIQGNYIGISADGNAALGNGAQGILDQGSWQTAVWDNVISANGEGIEFTDNNEHLPAEQAVVLRNKIGTDATGLLPLGNHNRGIVIRQAINCRIGGIDPTEGNLIAYNRSVGILLTSGHTREILMLSNSIHSNEEQSIDLSLEAYGFPDAISPNDDHDTDGGPNEMQNYPVILYVQRVGAQTEIRYQFQSAANERYVVQFFAAPKAAGSRQWGEAQRLLAHETLTTDAEGLYAAELRVPGLVEEGTQLSAIAAHIESGNTSEFSLPVAVSGQDSDQDGIADSRDLDDDNDGIADLRECQRISGSTLSLQTDPAGDDDFDGVPNYRDADVAQLNAKGVVSQWDSDADGIPDFLDLDSDNDGVPDLIEAGGVDINGDGQIDLVQEPGRTGVFYIDFDGDGIADAGTSRVWDKDGDGWSDLYDDAIEGAAPGKPLLCLDQNGNGIADFQDDTMGGSPQAREVAFSDADGDGFNDAFDPIDNDGKADNDLAFDKAANTPQRKTGSDPDRDGHLSSHQALSQRKESVK